MNAHLQSARETIWAALYLPHLQTDRLIRAGRAAKDTPLAVYKKDASAFVLTDVNAAALECGLRRAMALADARALYPNLHAIEAEPLEDARLLDQIAAWCGRFTPVVAIDGADGLFLDISGCGHLFGGDEALRDELIGRLRAQGFTAHAALAPTPGAAWALARFASQPNGGEGRLERLPVEALRLEEESAALLRRLGLKMIGQLYDAPRAAFTARAGVAAMRRLDQALGRAPEAVQPRRPAPPVFALRRFLEPLFSVETILIATRALCDDVVASLDQRGVGARRCALHLFGVDGRDRVIEIGVSRPERNAQALLRLFREKLNLAAENLDAEFGIEAARLDVVQLERMESAARALVAGNDAQASAEQVAAIVDVLSARLGPQRVVRPKLNNAHAPERAAGFAAFAGNAAASCATPLPGRRPLGFFARPQPIDAIATVPDGPPIRFRWRRVLREVARAEGPERIAGDWLRSEPTRDFYRVEDKQGRRYWLCREGFYGGDAAPRWFVAGLMP